MKRALAMILCLVLCLGLLSACGGGAAQTPAPAQTQAPAASTGEPAAANYLDNEPLRVATMVHQMGVSLYYADKHDLFKEAGINVDLSIFAGGAAINEAFGAGEIDGAISGLASVYSLANNIVKMVGEVDSVGADAIVVRNDSPILSAKGEIEGKPDMYGSAETLKGASFVCQVGQAQQFYALKYVSQFGLTEDDISFINMEDAAAYQAYVTGNGDVIASKMPYIYNMVVEDGNYTIAATCNDATGIMIKDPILFTPDTIANRSEEVKIFLKVIYDLIDHWANEDYDAYLAAVKEFYTENGKTYDDDLVTYEFSQNKLFSSDVLASADYCMGDGMQAVADFYGTTGAITENNVDNVYKNYDTSLLEAALGIKVNSFSK